MPHTSSEAVIRPDTLADFGAILIVFLFFYLTSFLTPFLVLSFLLIYFLNHLLSALSTPSRICLSISRPEVIDGDQTWL